MSDSEEEDSYCVYGTALDPLDEDEIPKKKCNNIEDQVATDEYGRRRFHGAFTGGFSAGFFNTVGSRKGWAPSEFKSSRAEKTTNKIRKPEDYMDDEDIGHFGFAPKGLQTTDDYTSSSRNLKRKQQRFVDGPIPGQPVLQLFLESAKETVGVRLLRSMGWKPGQGVGPRLTKSEKKRTTKRQNQYSGKIYGCEIPAEFRQNQQNEGSNESSDDSDTELNEITFAPNDYDPYIVKPKENRFGMGYIGLNKQPVLSHFSLFDEPSKFSMVGSNNKKLSITGQAFGVGAFEEEDEDIYSKDDLTRYDFALENVKSPNSKKQLALPSAKPDILPGFVLASIPIIQNKVFPPPNLPKSFIPIHKARISRFDPLPEERKPRTSRHNLNATDRTVIINETAMSVADKQTDDSRLEGSEKEKILNEAKKITADLPRPVYGESGFKPFIANPDKQKRYEEYLKLTEKDKLTELQPVTMTEWEKEREKVEFEQASKMYRPLNLLDKFVQAKQADDFNDPLAEVKKSQIDHGTEQMREAARLKMFGKLTREIDTWQPNNLLCKRFNVPVPNADVNSKSQKKTVKCSIFDRLDFKTPKTPSTLNETPENKTEEPNDGQESIEIVDENEESTRPIIENERPDNNVTAETNNENKIAIEPETPIKLPKMQLPEPSTTVTVPSDPDERIDLFKAIFLSSSESENESEKEEETKEDKISKMKEIILEEPIVKPINVERNKSPPRGIFADLDAINKTMFDKSTELQNTRAEETKTAENEIDVDESSGRADIYGPKLPSVLVKTGERKIENNDKRESSDDCDEWVEKNKSKSKSRHRKEKKHKKDRDSSSHKKDKQKKEKHKHKKHKSKHKHRKSKYSDSD